MRLHERALTEIRLAARDASGSLERFAEETKSCRGVCLPYGGALSYGDDGLTNGQRLRLILPGATEVEVGDGAWVGDRRYVVERVDVLSGHRELVCRLP